MDQSIVKHTLGSIGLAILLVVGIFAVAGAAIYGQSQADAEASQDLELVETAAVDGAEVELAVGRHPIPGCRYVFAGWRQIGPWIIYPTWKTYCPGGSSTKW